MRYLIRVLLLLLIFVAGGAVIEFSHLKSEEREQDRPEKSYPIKPRSAEQRLSGAVGIKFVDVAASAGLRYRWSIPGKRPLNILQSIGNGCAFLDYDHDGNLDLLLVGPRPALYRGDGHGHFTDVTHQSGLDKVCGHFLGVAVGDYDNDGYPDLYLSGYQTGLLLHNEGGGKPEIASRSGTVAKRAKGGSGAEAAPRLVGESRLQGRRFRDVTAAMGLKPQPWGTSCAFADLDGDGFLDLFVCNYVQFGPESQQFCEREGIQTACDPGHYPVLRGVLYHNFGGRRFADVTQSYELAGQTGNALGVACADFTDSGHIGMAIANDGPGDDLYQNSEPGRLQNISLQAGTRTDRGGNKHAGMGVDWGDYDNDGKLDFVVTTFESEAKCLYHNEGHGLFTERSSSVGVEQAMIPFVSFGCKFVDVDNDGWLDLLVASGHVYDGIDSAHHGRTYRQPVKLLYNTGGKAGQPITFLDMKRGSGLEKLAPIVGRGLATGDFDNDGRVDALVVDSEGRPLLLHNESRPVGHWIGLHLEGRGRSNRDAYGAVVTVEMNGRRLIRVCHADGSYLSASDGRVHIGLGKTDHVDSITIRWPDGVTAKQTNPPIDRYLAWVEGCALTVAPTK